MAIDTKRSQSIRSILPWLSHVYRSTLPALYAIRLRIEYIKARLKHKKIAFVLGTPDHYNLGDQAIALAQKRFLHSLNKNFAIIEVPMPFVMRDRRHLLIQMIKDNDIIFGHGGGNMGDAYLEEERCRRRFVQDFPNNKILIFPQTIYFSDTKIGRSELKETIAVYSRHKDLTLIGREQVSYKEMLHDFPTNKVILTPDIVLSTNYSTESLQRKGALLCLRSDMESKLSEAEKTKLSLFCSKRFSEVRSTDTISTAKLFELRLKKRAVEKKLNEFRSAEFVITDRLHGMVFAAITGTPCIALTNYNHKVLGTYEWIKPLPYIKFCDDVDTLHTLYKQIDIHRTYEYDPNYFNTYWNKIKNAIQQS